MPAKELTHTEIDNRPQLPDILPQDEVTVRGEAHVYEKFDTDSGEQDRLNYPLKKAPINAIEGIRGTDSNGNSRSFSSGVDFVLSDLTREHSESFTYFTNKDGYELVDPPDNPATVTITDDSGDTYSSENEFEIINPDDVARDTIKWINGEPTPDNGEAFRITYTVTFEDSSIEWLTDGDNLPRVGSEFYVTYRAQSIISRYLDSSEDELRDLNDVLEEVIENKYINSASGRSLDEIGRLFGPLIGKRRDRTDDEYRVFLRSAIQSFISRGTVNGIKFAVSAATDVPLDDITIEENFEDNSYQLIIVAATPVTGSLIEEIAEVADPSGVNQVRTRFTIPVDEIQSDDSVRQPDGSEGSTTDSAASSDSTDETSRRPIDTIGATDTTSSTIEAVALWSQADWDDGSEWTVENN